MVEFITIGKIRENSKSLIIYCGDYHLMILLNLVFVLKTIKLLE